MQHTGWIVLSVRSEFASDKDMNATLAIAVTDGLRRLQSASFTVETQ